MSYAAGDEAVQEASLDEQALIESARMGDETAREELVRRYLPAVYQATSRVLRDRQLAEDAAQDAFVNALANLARFRGEASFRTWLLRIAVNAAHSIGRRQTRRREVDIDAAAAWVDGRPDAAASAADRSELERVERALQQLPPKQRLVVTLRAQQGLSYREIATILECTEGAARVNYHLGVKRLRELIT